MQRSTVTTPQSADYIVATHIL